ncbi:MAG: carbamate kinase [Lachnospiraceae bacterium]|jgi:carbamate kinase|nr:carbamate kinase [Lachnospiraceae bacterium]
MKEKKRIVIALGGNALGNTLTEQVAACKVTAKAIVDLIEEGHEIIITHGNGPQVGMIQNAMAALSREDPAQPNTPLFVSVSMSQAYIGYDLQKAIGEEMAIRGIPGSKHIATVVTRVRVDADDPAFANPSKPIGKFLTKEEADIVAEKYGHLMKEDAGRGYRRYVPSPRPLEIIEIGAIRNLVSAGEVVISCGGGGIPVILEGKQLNGVSAVIDKDFVSGLLARELNADYLIILTAVEKVAINFRKENEEWISDLTVAKAKKYVDEGQFAAGSMLPKVEAAIAFADSKMGRQAIITELEKAKDALDGKTGTLIHL